MAYSRSNGAIMAWNSGSSARMAVSSYSSARGEFIVSLMLAICLSTLFWNRESSLFAFSQASVFSRIMVSPFRVMRSSSWGRLAWSLSNSSLFSVTLNSLLFVLEASAR